MLSKALNNHCATGRPIFWSLHTPMKLTMPGRPSSGRSNRLVFHLRKGLLSLCILPRAGIRESRSSGARSSALWLGRPKSRLKVRKVNCRAQQHRTRVTALGKHLVHCQT